MLRHICSQHPIDPIFIFSSNSYPEPTIFFSHLFLLSIFLVSLEKENQKKKSKKKKIKKETNQQSLPLPFLPSPESSRCLLASPQASTTFHEFIGVGLIKIQGHQLLQYPPVINFFFASPINIASQSRSNLTSFIASEASTVESSSRTSKSHSVVRCCCHQLSKPVLAFTLMQLPTSPSSAVLG